MRETAAEIHAAQPERLIIEGGNSVPGVEHGRENRAVFALSCRVGRLMCDGSLERAGARPVGDRLGDVGNRDNDNVRAKRTKRLLGFRDNALQRSVNIRASGEPTSRTPQQIVRSSWASRIMAEAIPGTLAAASRCSTAASVAHTKSCSKVSFAIRQ